ncbi:hypothetical protein OIDMADRAFT_20779, partial [Oidiodendron maius Zn]
MFINYRDKIGTTGGGRQRPHDSFNHYEQAPQHTFTAFAIHNHKLTNTAWGGLLVATIARGLFAAIAGIWCMLQNEITVPSGQSQDRLL